MQYSFYELSMLVFLYSFLGWLVETGVVTLKEKSFRNRGLASGPVCFIYGWSAVILAVFLQDLRNEAAFLLLGSTIIATAIQWFTGKALERMKRRKWWDYSGKKWNYDGYICVWYSLLWGVLGFITVRYTNDFFLRFYNFLPELLEKVIVWLLLSIAFIDVAGSVMSICHLGIKLPGLLRWNRRLQAWTVRFGTGIAEHINHRIGKVYLVTTSESDKEELPERPLGAAQLFWLFFIGAFLGDIVETIFCRLTAGVWMSRSSLVWGPFSIVWGLAMALATALLHKDREKPDRHIFIVGTLLGGAYEYICSVFTELVFGKVFWDYSEIPFNLGGRINLLYCFFWGIAAVVWIKMLYPKMADIIERILERTGRWLTVILVLFMLINMVVSALALVRYDARAKGAEAKYSWENAIDVHFDDARMEQIYPNAKIR